MKFFFFKDFWIEITFWNTDIMFIPVTIHFQYENKFLNFSNVFIGFVVDLFVRVLLTF